jgi:hypothetical protein
MSTGPQNGAISSHSLRIVLMSRNCMIESNLVKGFITFQLVFIFIYTLSNKADNARW